MNVVELSIKSSIVVQTVYISIHCGININLSIWLHIKPYLYNNPRKTSLFIESESLHE